MGWFKADFGRLTFERGVPGLSLLPVELTAAVPGLLAVFNAGFGGTGKVTVAALDSFFMCIGREKVVMGLDEIRCVASSSKRDLTSLTVPSSTG